MGTVWGGGGEAHNPRALLVRLGRIVKKRTNAIIWFKRGEIDLFLFRNKLNYVSDKLIFLKQ